VTNRGALRVVLAPLADDVDDFLFHHLGQHAEPDADASLAESTSCPSASCTRGGNASSPCPT
jgi:hypothetical protein